MNSERRAPGLLTTIVLLAAGCADLERGQPRADAGGAPVDGRPVSGDAAGVDASTPALSFARDVHPLLLTACERCHSEAGQANRSALVLVGDATRDLAQVAKFINQDNPAASRLLTKGAGTGHEGGAALLAGTPEYRTILAWITQGSLP